MRAGRCLISASESQPCGTKSHLLLVHVLVRVDIRPCQSLVGLKVGLVEGSPAARCSVSQNVLPTPWQVSTHLPPLLSSQRLCPCCRWTWSVTLRFRGWPQIAHVDLWIGLCPGMCWGPFRPWEGPNMQGILKSFRRWLKVHLWSVQKMSDSKSNFVNHFYTFNMSFWTYQLGAALAEGLVLMWHAAPHC